MSFKWAVDADYPGGHLVQLTPAEEAQRDVDQAAGVVETNLENAKSANRALLVDAITARMATLRQARTALAGGSIFSSLSVGERKVLDLLLQDDLQFGRLALQMFDATDA